jgi:eukaryotic-like serine/threonine-protein kinase
MTSRRWQRVEALFHASLTASREQRRAILDADTDEPHVRREVESLLEAHDSDRDFMHEPLLEAAGRTLAAGSFTDARPTIEGCEIHGLLGRGGMGDVYRARDVQLDRPVAVKLLHPHAAPDGRAYEQLSEEARSAARISHPGVCTVYRVGHSAGRPYLVMELVEGETLAGRLRRGPLTPATTIHLALQVVDVVADAHRHGVMHGDLKNTNVMVRPDGTVKVLDFGLAQRLAGSGGVMPAAERRAEQGAVCGTLAYMAPELLRDEPADVRSDLWAVGVLLHEMLTGRVPFAGPTEEQLPSAILHAPPSELPSSVPAPLRAVIRRCLSKDRRDRYQSASELQRDLLDARLGATEVPEPSAARRPGRSQPASRLALKGLAAAVATVALLLAGGSIARRWERPMPETSVSAARARLAVMPLRIDDPRGEPHYAVAFADVLATQLASVPDIRVSPTAFVVSRMGTAGDATGAGKALHVDYVLTGSVRRTGNRYQLAVSLTDVRERARIWSGQYELTLDDLPRVGGSIAREIAARLGAASPPHAGSRAEPARWPDIDAYLRGRALLAQRSPDAMSQAVGAFEAVLKTDPSFAPAHAGLAVAAARLLWYTGGRGAGSEWRERANRAAQRALELEPSLAEAHEALAAVYRYDDLDWALVIEESRKALALNAGLDLPHFHLAVAFYHLGLFELSEAASEAGYQANMENRHEFLFNRGRAALYAGRFKEAKQLLDEALVMQGGSPGWTEAEAYFYAGERARSEAILRSVMLGDRIVSRWRAAAALATFLVSRGARDEGRQVLGALLTQAPSDHHAQYRVATAYAQLGDPSNAQRWLTAAADGGFPCYAWFAADPMLAPARQAPGIDAFLSRLRAQSHVWRDKYSLQHEARP